MNYELEGDESHGLKFEKSGFLRNDKVTSTGSGTGIRQAQSPVLVSFFFLGLDLVGFSS